jgi:hypothetical protein
MADVLPAPQVPTEVDLQDFAFFHLDAVRLRDSMLALKASGDEFRAAIILWCVAWHQVPAASLPDDDAALASYAGCGRDLKGWRKIRSGALRGFQKCSDGRLYHGVLAEKAIEAWDGKLRYRHRKECERIKKACQRAKVLPEYPTFEEWNEHRLATGLDRWGEVLSGDDTGTEGGDSEGHPGHVLDHVPGDTTGTQQGRPSNVSTEVPRESLPLKGEGEGEGEGEYINQKKPPDEPAVASPISKRKNAITIDTWLASLDGDHAVPPNDPVFRYGERVGIPEDFLGLAWTVFRDRMRGSSKRQKDWRQTFRNYVENNYLKLWWIDPQGDYRLTTVGQQAQRQAA